jgi:hypothetical protein
MSNNFDLVLRVRLVLNITGNDKHLPGPTVDSAIANQSMGQPFGNGSSLAGQIIFHDSDPLSDQSWFDPDTMTG